MKRFLWLVSIILLMCLPVSADFIKWVDFDVPYESLQYAMNVDIDSFEEEQHSVGEVSCPGGCSDE